MLNCDLIQSINYAGHLLIKSEYKTGEAYDQYAKGQANIAYKIVHAESNKTDDTLKLHATATVTAKAEDGLNVFSIDVEYHSIFHGASFVDENNYSDYDWFLKKFVHRSGKQIIDDILKNTAFNSLRMPSFLPTPKSDEE